MASCLRPAFLTEELYWQVVGVLKDRLAALGAAVLEWEKIRPHVPLERAVMALRLSPHMVGVQFHPEAGPTRMRALFSKPEKREEIMHRQGEEKYRRILEAIDDHEALPGTHATILPRFLHRAVSTLCPQWQAGTSAGVVGVIIIKKEVRWRTKQRDVHG